MHSLPPLDECIAELKALLSGQPTRPDHFLSDLLLVNLATDILEHSQAVATLSPMLIRRAAYANVRAAVEAAQDLMFLVGDEAQYNRRGCMARAFELLEFEGLQGRFHHANVVAELPSQAGQSAADTGRTDSEEWDAISPGSGSQLMEEFDRMRSGGLPRHWSGMSRKQLVAFLEAQPGGEPGFAAMQDAFYGVLSVQAHARPRMSNRALEEDGAGHWVINPQPDDGTSAPGLASWACLTAAWALRRRRSYYQRAT